ncbi:hypothetical protein BELL_0643g00060 [Botrytis elliptica]|uniref:Uncharacterized protein n=1 Tax=Botrytis elliptica TaxID=278938 RepID=A0A4Z1JI39_9HELO|nr:hypothetical protein BELL_0643g00060 [Botrytis elliptica]
MGLKPTEGREKWKTCDCLMEGVRGSARFVGSDCGAKQKYNSDVEALVLLSSNHIYIPNNGHDYILTSVSTYENRQLIPIDRANI